MDNYTIHAINEDGTVDVSFSCDNKTQTLSGLPLDNVDSLHQALVEYYVSYKSGLDMSATPTVAPDVQKVLNTVVPISQQDISAATVIGLAVAEPVTPA